MRRVASAVAVLLACTASLATSEGPDTCADCSGDGGGGAGGDLGRPLVVRDDLDIRILANAPPLSFDAVILAPRDRGGIATARIVARNVGGVAASVHLLASVSGTTQEGSAFADQLLEPFESVEIVATGPWAATQNCDESELYPDVCEDRLRLDASFGGETELELQFAASADTVDDGPLRVTLVAVEP